MGKQLEINFVKELEKSPDDKDMDDIAKEARVTFDNLMNKYGITKVDKKAIRISCMWMV